MDPQFFLNQPNEEKLKQADLHFTKVITLAASIQSHIKIARDHQSFGALNSLFLDTRELHNSTADLLSVASEYSEELSGYEQWLISTGYDSIQTQTRLPIECHVLGSSRRRQGQ